MSGVEGVPEDVWAAAEAVSTQVLAPQGEQIKVMTPLIARAIRAGATP